MIGGEGGMRRDGNNGGIGVLWMRGCGWMGVGRQLERLIRNLMLPLMTSEPDKHLSNISKNLAVHPHVVSVCLCVREFVCV